MTDNKVSQSLLKVLRGVEQHKNAEVENTNEKKGQTEAEFEKFLSEQQADDKNGVHISQHAAKRLRERDIPLDNDEFLKIRDALDKLKDKGGRDSLIITQKAAYIVDVDKRKVVTAIEKDNLQQNVFTKIDSTLFVN